MNELFGQPESVSSDAETTGNEAKLPEAPIQLMAVEPETPALEKISADVCNLKEIILTMQARLSDVETALDAAAKQVAFLPPQMRLLGNKIDGAAVSLSEPRYRSVLLNLLGLYDLLDQMSRALPVTPDDQTGADHYRNYEILRTQLRQVLVTNGLSQIETGGAFNPELHRAVQRVSCSDPAQSGQVIEVVRIGFRTEQAVLRYAEVIVGQYLPSKSESGEDHEADQPTADTQA
jgi:molecular chaperone GrpE (heat shock protein)